MFEILCTILFRMRLLLQKVIQASVTVDNQLIGSIGEGYLLFLGVQKGDTTQKADWLVHKILSMRLFSVSEGETMQNILEKGAEILVVSQFTLAARIDHGTKPDFTDAASGSEAEPFYEYFISCLRAAGVSRVATGQFGALMSVELINNGPYTLWLDR